MPFSEKFMNLKNKLEKEFALAKNEKELVPFLKNNSILIRNAFNRWAWNYVSVIPEFSLSDTFRVDFLIVSADSGSWGAIFVELKSHRKKIFNKNGTPSKDLNIGLRQLDERERWLKNNERIFREKLSTYFEKDKVPAYCSNASTHTNAFTEILDIKTYIDFKYAMVIGRREELNREDQGRRYSFRMKDREISTYDRLLDVANKLDTAFQIKS